MLEILVSLLFLLAQDERVLMGYFMENQTPRHLVLDRRSDRATVSVAATGFGYYAWAVAVEDGLLDRRQAVDWINESMDFLLSKTPKKNLGWLYHWVDPDGEPKFNKEISSIDTALYWLGARRAAVKLKDEALLKKVNDNVARIDRSWMMGNGGLLPDKRLFSHGFFWNADTPVFINVDWDEYSEGLLIYRLFEVPFQPRKVEYGLPLFVYFYLTCFYDEPEYRQHLCQAVAWQVKNLGHCGVTACDGPNGYTIGDPRVVSPLAVWACSPVCKEAASHLPKMRFCRTTPSYHVKDGWRASDRIGIDDGSCLMMLRR